MIDDSDILELRVLEILETKEKWWTLEEISTQLQISKATVQKYLNVLKNRVENYSEQEISIETSTSKGIFFHRLPSFNVQVIYTEILKDLLTFEILNSFLYSEHVSAVKFSLEHYVSVASVRRKYKVINDYLEDLGMAIKKEQLKGDERQIRSFYASLYWETFKGVEWPFDLIPRRFVEHLLDRVQTFFNMELVPETKEEMMFWITINGLRHLKGYRVEEDKEIHNYAQNNPLFPQFVEILQQIFPNETKNNDPRALGELQYQFLLISTLPVLEKSEDYNNIIYQAHKKGNTIMYQMTQDWLELYHSIFEESREKSRDLEGKLLRIHSFAYLYKIGGPIFFKNSYVDELITYHPNFLKKMRMVYDRLSQKYDVFKRNKDYLIENYILLVLDRKDINQFEQSIRLALSFSKGLIYETVVQEKLEANFKGRYKLEFVSAEEPKELLITDLSHIFNEKAQIVSVNTQLTSRDYENIEKLILEFI